jgi:hypothetical protein
MIKKYTQAKELKIDTTILNKKSIVKNLLRRYDVKKTESIIKQIDFNSVLLTKTDLELIF